VLHESLLSDSHHSSFLLTIRLPFCPTTAWPCKRPNTLHYNDCKMSSGSFELPHKGLGSEWRQQFSTYVMLMLVGFRDSVMTSMITKPIPIAWTTQKAQLFCSRIRYSKHWLFILLAWTRGRNQPNRTL